MVHQDQATSLAYRGVSALAVYPSPNNMNNSTAAKLGLQKRDGGVTINNRDLMGFHIYI